VLRLLALGTPQIRIRKCCTLVTKMLHRIRLLLMPDLSTAADARMGHFDVFGLAPRTLHVSFQSSDDRDARPPGHQG
jgi:hypothetical protein